MENQYLQDLKKIEISINKLIYELQVLRNQKLKDIDSITKTSTEVFLKKHKNNISTRLKKNLLRVWEGGYIEDIKIEEFSRWDGIGKKSIIEFQELRGY